MSGGHHVEKCHLILAAGQHRLPIRQVPKLAPRLGIHRLLAEGMGLLQQQLHRQLSPLPVRNGVGRDGKTEQGRVSIHQIHPAKGPPQRLIHLLGRGGIRPLFKQQLYLIQPLNLLKLSLLGLAALLQKASHGRSLRLTLVAVLL